jgi:hypothetical protein
MIDNLKKIIQFKIDNSDKVILLLGNHELSYLFGRPYLCSGYRAEIAFEIYDLINNNRDLFTVIYKYKNYIFSHAGITNKWVKRYIKDINAAFRAIKIKFKLKNKKYTLFDKIEWLQYTEWGREIIFSPCSIRSDNPFFTGGLLWADKKVTMNDSLKGFHQIVGHTPLTKYNFETYGKDDTTITYIDILGSLSEFYELEI